MILLRDTDGYGILRQDVCIPHAYLSNVAISRLANEGMTLSKYSGKRVLLRAKVFGIRTALFSIRERYLSTLLALDGEVYEHEGYLYGLVFPVDLINFHHIRIKRWGFL